MSEKGEEILVVDDNEANARLMTFLLQHEGYRAHVAGSGRAAREFLATRVPTLVLMDIQLPDTDGLSLTRELRQDPRLAGVFVVALTAFAMKGDEERMLEAGCDAYLTKPISTREFPSQLGEFLARAELRRGGAR